MTLDQIQIRLTKAFERLTSFNLKKNNIKKRLLLIEEKAHKNKNKKEIDAVRNIIDTLE